jgi:hypothetical protein
MAGVDRLDLTHGRVFGSCWSLRSADGEGHLEVCVAADGRQRTAAATCGSPQVDWLVSAIAAFKAVDRAHHSMSQASIAADRGHATVARR